MQDLTPQERHARGLCENDTLLCAWCRLEAREIERDRQRDRVAYNY